MGVNSLPKTVYQTASRLRFEPGPAFCAWVQHANHSATEPPIMTGHVVSEKMQTHRHTYIHITILRTAQSVRCSCSCERVVGWYCRRHRSRTREWVSELDDHDEVRYQQPNDLTPEHRNSRFSCFYVLCRPTVCVVVFYQWRFIDLFSCIAASQFNKLTYLLKNVGACSQKRRQAFRKVAQRHVYYVVGLFRDWLQRLWTVTGNVSKQQGFNLLVIFIVYCFFLFGFKHDFNQLCIYDKVHYIL